MVRFGNREVGDGAPCFITYEAGATHDGLETAKSLVRLAAEAGADAVKFQIFDPDKLVADKAMKFGYEILADRDTGETKAIEESLYEILVRRCMSRAEWRELKRYSDSLELAFFATVGFEEDIELIEELGCHSVKIASADVNHFPLIRRAARTGMCLQLDTGNATIGEIERAVDVIRAEGNDNIIIHQCPSGYPARLESINLRIIPTLKQLFPYPVAYSDHTPGWEMDVAAIALGANLVEKTITHDRTTPSVEHIFSLEPEDMRQFIETIREVETAMGQPRRILHPAEIERRANIRRSAFLTAAAKGGTKLDDLAIEFRRPGHGIAPDTFESLTDLTVKHDLEPGHMLTYADFG